MDRVFRVDFYPHEWLTLTAHMSIQQRGIFIQICMMIYAKRGKIINDPSHIGRISNCSTRLARAIILQLSKQGDIQVHGTFITQKRCESELNKKRTHLESSSNGGRTRVENERENKKNSNLTSSEALSTPPSSSPPPPRTLKKVSKTDSTPTKPVTKKIKAEKTLDIEPMGAMEFERFWEIFPQQRRGDRGHAFNQWKKAIQIISASKIISTAEEYAISDEVARGFVTSPEKWLREHRWNNIYRPPDIIQVKQNINGGNHANPTKDDRARAAIMRAASAGGYAISE